MDKQPALQIFTPRSQSAATAFATRLAKLRVRESAGFKTLAVSADTIRDINVTSRTGRARLSPVQIAKRQWVAPQENKVPRTPANLREIIAPKLVDNIDSVTNMFEGAGFLYALENCGKCL